MYDTPLRIGRLEMIEPPFSFGSIYQSTLMRTIYFGHSHLQHTLRFIRTVNIFRTHHRLPTGTDAAFGNADVIVTILFKKFRTFGHRTFIYFLTSVKKPCAVRTHFMNINRATAQLATPDISLPILIPERTGIFPTTGTLHTMQRRPGAGRICGGRHKQTVIRHTDEHPEFPVMIAQSRRPATVAITFHFRKAGIVDTIVYLTDNGPVNHIFGFENRYSHKMELRTDHIIFISHPDNIRIGIVAIQDGVGKCPVTQISPTGIGVPTTRTA